MKQLYFFGAALLLAALVYFLVLVGPSGVETPQQIPGAGQRALPAPAPSVLELAPEPGPARAERAPIPAASPQPSSGFPLPAPTPNSLAIHARLQDLRGQPIAHRRVKVAGFLANPPFSELFGPSVYSDIEGRVAVAVDLTAQQGMACSVRIESRKDIEYAFVSEPLVLAPGSIDLGTLSMGSLSGIFPTPLLSAIVVDEVGSPIRGVRCAEVFEFSADGPRAAGADPSLERVPFVLQPSCLAFELDGKGGICVYGPPRPQLSIAVDAPGYSQVVSRHAVPSFGARIELLRSVEIRFGVHLDPEWSLGSRLSFRQKHHGEAIGHSGMPERMLAHGELLAQFEWRRPADELEIRCGDFVIHTAALRYTGGDRIDLGMIDLRRQLSPVQVEFRSESGRPVTQAPFRFGPGGSEPGAWEQLESLHLDRQGRWIGAVPSSRAQVGLWIRQGAEVRLWQRLDLSNSPLTVVVPSELQDAELEQD